MIGQTVSTSAILNTTLADFRKNPFCPEYIIDTLIKRGYNTLSDILDITEFDAMSIPGFGKGKVRKLMDLRVLLSTENICSVEKFCHKHIDMALIPSHGAGSASLAQRITEVISVMADAFDGNGKHELSLLCREYFLAGRTLSDIHSDPSLHIDVTRERLRQQTVWLRSAIENSGMLKYRVEIDHQFTTELEQVKSIVAYCPKSVLRSLLGEGAPEHCFVHLFNFDILGPDCYCTSAIDQEYIVAPDSSINEMIKDLQAIVNELHDEVRPMMSDELYARILSKRPKMSKEAFAKIISNHSLISEDEEGMVYLDYKALYDYEKVARLIWENQEISNDDIDAKHKEMTGESRSIAANTHVAQHKYSWCRPMGKSGIWVYTEEDSSNKLNLRSFVKDYVQKRGVFSYARALKEVVKTGYRYPEKTVRAYFMAECRVSTMDADIMCSTEKANTVSGISWRKKSADSSKEELAELAMDILKTNGPMTRNALTSEIRKVEPSRMGNDATVWKWVNILCQEGKMLSMDSENLVHVSKNAAFELSQAQNAEKIIPSHYRAVVDEIVRIISNAPGKMCQMSDLKNACSLIISPYAKDNLFYKIVDRYRPQNIEKVYLNGNTYLRQVA